MGILDCASGASIWRGYDYHKAGKVLKIVEFEPNNYLAVVEGKSEIPYSVELNVIHPRKSKCNCPHADGKRIICKHIVAAYFSVFPEEAEKLYAEAIAYQAESEKREIEIYDKVQQYVRHMKKNELQEALLQLLFGGPEWQYDRFVRDNGLDD